MLYTIPPNFRPESRVIDQLAPERTKQITRKEKRPWFDDDIAGLRRVLRRSEKIWMRIRSENNWRRMWL